MALKPPIPRQGLLKRKHLEAALQDQERVFIDGAQQVPPSGTTPTGTGFRHVTDGTEDPAAKLVDTADINPNQVTYDKIQQSAGASILLGVGDDGPGNFREIALGTGLEMDGDTLNVTVQSGSQSLLWQSESPAQVGVHKKYHHDRTGEVVWMRLENPLGDGLSTAQVDVLKNGASIFTVATKPNVGAGNEVGAQAVPDDVDFEDLDTYQINIISTGLTSGPLRLRIRFTEVLP